MFQVTFFFAGAATQSWAPDKDVVLVGTRGIMSHSVSTNPTRLLADFTAPAATTIVHEFSLYNQSTSSLPNINPQLKIPIQAGKKIYVVAQGAGTVFLFFENSAETIAT
jgi:hypothetical protein